MSMFWCAKCDNLRDSDEGCAEYGSKGTELICIDCMGDLEDEALGESLGSGGKYSYEEILDGLLKAGCPDNIARELAREKSR